MHKLSGARGLTFLQPHPLGDCPKETLPTTNTTAKSLSTPFGSTCSKFLVAISVFFFPLPDPFSFSLSLVKTEAVKCARLGYQVVM